MRSPSSVMPPLVTSPRSPLSRLEMARSVVVFTGAVAAQQGHDAVVRHLQEDALEHQDHVVVDDFDAVDLHQRRGALAAEAAVVGWEAALMGSPDAHCLLAIGACQASVRSAILL